MKTYRMLRYTLALAACLAFAPYAWGKGGVVHRSHAYLAGVGFTNILDTYLSPEKYRGTDLRFLSLMKRESDSTAWVRLIEHEGNIAFADNRSGNGGEMGGAYTFRYGAMHRWRLTVGGRQLQLAAGAKAALNLGFLYNTRGSNNPAQARVALHVGPAVAAALPIGRASHMRGVALAHGDCAHHPVVLHYEASATLFGLMFSPNYGQSYYEIFSRGNYDHNVVPTTFAATPCFRQMLTLDFRLIGTTWRMGYLGDFYQADVNRIKQHTYTNSLVVGIVKTF